MDIRFQARAPLAGEGSEKSEWRADLAIIPAFDGEDALAGIAALLESAPWIGISPAVRDFKGGKGDLLTAYGHPDMPVSRAMFAGLGKRADLKPGTLRDAVAGAVQAAAARKLEHLALPVESLASLGASPAELVEEAVLGAKLGLYANILYKSKASKDGSKDDSDERFTPKSFILLFAEESVPDELAAAARKAEAVADGIIMARDLINGPANVITPGRLEEEAQRLARTYGFNCTSLGPDYLRNEGMGAFWAVARGAEEEPRLIILEHVPAGTENDAPLIVVGKGITFDSGGISLKPSTGMERMKTDMAGAGTVLGLFAALGECRGGLAKKRVIGIIGCTENMPDGKATRPGDIVTTLAGKTVEITNTDAEGRLVLCDCLTLAQNRWQPSLLVDIATLTGACVVALGMKTTGVFTNDDALAAKVIGIGKEKAERFWHLPIFDQDLDTLKSDTADLNNTGPREGGASFAALFLKQFVKDSTPWVHLDVAGPARQDKKTPTCPGGATAVGLQTLFELATR